MTSPQEFLDTSKDSPRSPSPASCQSAMKKKESFVGTVLSLTSGETKGIFSSFSPKSS